MKTKFILVLLLMSLCGFFGAGCSGEIISTTKIAMGTEVTIEVRDSNLPRAQEAIDEVYMEISRLENILSEYKETSPVAQLNREGVLTNPAPELLANMRAAVYYGKLTDGAFDITVWPILLLYRESFQASGNPPTADEIRREALKVDYRKIVLTENRISLGKDQQVTLGGIAKGYVIDRAVEMLKQRGIKNGFVDAGGDIRFWGEKDFFREWVAGLRNPRAREDFVTLIQAHNMAVVTSGDYERYFDENKKYHHIINPRTGYSATELISVTVIAKTAFDADALSTAVFVLGHERGLALIESLTDTECLIITAQKEVMRSSGFGRYEISGR